MNFKEYWDDLLKKKPIGDKQKVVMTKEQFFNMQKKAYTKGFWQGYYQLKDNALKSKNKPTTFEELFEEFDKIFKEFFEKKSKEQ